MRRPSSALAVLLVLLGTQELLKYAAARPWSPDAVPPTRGAPQPLQPASVCDLETASKAADAADCTYVVADPQGKALLFGDAPLAGAPPPGVHILASAPHATAGSSNDGKTAPPLFHEAGVWLHGAAPQRHRVLFSSNRLGNTSSADQHVDLHLVDPFAPTDSSSGDSDSSSNGSPADAARPLTPRDPGALPMANGGTALPGAGGRVAIMTYQGLRERGGGLAALNVETGEVRIVVASAGASGKRLNSPNDVVVVPVPGAPRFAVALFTDPSYGYDQNFRTTPPEVGQYVWAVTLRLPDPAAAAANNGTAARWWPIAVGPARAVAEGFVRPNGLAVSPDRATLYVSDTGYRSGGGNGGTDTVGSGPPVRTWSNRPRAIYAFDLAFVRSAAAAATAELRGRRLFAVAEAGIPDGLRCDAAGRLWSGEGDGVAAYEPGTGRLLLRVRPGDGGGARSAGVANFAIVPAGGGGSSGGATLVMGQEQAVTAVTLPGLRAFDTDRWLEDGL